MIEAIIAIMTLPFANICKVLRVVLKTKGAAQRCSQHSYRDEAYVNIFDFSILCRFSYAVYHDEKRKVRKCCPPKTDAETTKLSIRYMY